MSNGIIKAWNSLLGKSQNVRSVINCLGTAPIEHLHIHEGKGFTHSNVHSMASGATLHHLIQTNSGQSVHLSSYLTTADKAPMFIRLYEGPVVTSIGAVQAFTNNNRVSSNAAKTKISTSPVVTSIGLELEFSLLTGAKQSGGLGADIPTVWILPGSADYIIEVENASGLAALTEQKIFVYEPTNP